MSRNPSPDRGWSYRDFPGEPPIGRYKSARRLLDLAFLQLEGELEHEHELAARLYFFASNELLDAFDLHKRRKLASAEQQRRQGFRLVASSPTRTTTIAQRPALRVVRKGGAE